MKKRQRSRERSEKGRRSRRQRRSPSYASYSSHSSSTVDNKFEKKLERLREDTKKRKKKRSDSPFESRVRVQLPNKNALTNIIQDNIKRNVRLDTEEVSRASVNLRRFSPKREAKLMSSHINQPKDESWEDKGVIATKQEVGLSEVPAPYVCSYDVSSY